MASRTYPSLQRNQQWIEQRRERVEALAHPPVLLKDVLPRLEAELATAARERLAEDRTVSCAVGLNEALKHLQGLDAMHRQYVALAVRPLFMSQQGDARRRGLIRQHRDYVPPQEFINTLIEGARTL